MTGHLCEEEAVHSRAPGTTTIKLSMDSGPKQGSRATEVLSNELRSFDEGADCDRWAFKVIVAVVISVSTELFQRRRDVGDSSLENLPAEAP
jgi:hypothetical protein